MYIYMYVFTYLVLNSEIWALGIDIASYQNYPDIVATKFPTSTSPFSTTTRREYRRFDFCDFLCFYYLKLKYKLNWSGFKMPICVVAIDASSSVQIIDNPQYITNLRDSYKYSCPASTSNIYRPPRFQSIYADTYTLKTTEIFGEWQSQTGQYKLHNLHVAVYNP